MKTVKNQYFLKDKKAQLYKEVAATDPNDRYNRTVEFMVQATPSPYWCYSSQLSQDQIFIAAQYSQSETRLFVFNNKDTIDVYSFIRYRGKWYQATRVDTRDDYNNETFVYVRDARLGDIPKENEIKPYGWKPEDEGYISK